ncbi:MAG: S-adenosylmethionine:tRNA ribosyltransferase-isomerase [Bacteroidales bacterium]|nr:S-adenosylmethionine:tRNA ribosyltransferase-isomerase [Bacteroidales bacterium]
MYNPPEIKISNFDYPLEEENIAKYPLSERDKAKLLSLTSDKKIEEKYFYDLPEMLDSNTFLILNDTKVVHARLLFQKESGSVIEIFCLEPMNKDIQLAYAQKGSCEWKCLIGNNKKWKQETISSSFINDSKQLTLTAKRLYQENETWIVEFSWDREDLSFAEVLQYMGHVPLPPYLKRKDEESDKEDYQTVYAHQEGSVAAPTAGLHFSENTFKQLADKGVKTCFVTLHVGAGTFKPVSTETIDRHVMHTEQIVLKKENIEELLANLDKRVMCVGTTSVRTIESLYWHGVKVLKNGNRYSEIDVKQWDPYQEECRISAKESLQAILESMEQENRNVLIGQTQLMIAPGYEYRIVDAMITNFHQPKSTLLLLVSAMIGEDWKRVYQFALENNYRFLSFGDACMFTK